MADLIEQAAKDRYNQVMADRNPELTAEFGRLWARWEDLSQHDRDPWIELIYEEMRY